METSLEAFEQPEQGMGLTMEDMVLTGYVPNGGFLTTADLRDQLERVQAALRDNRQEQKGVEMEQI